MTVAENKTVERIARQYGEREVTKLDELKALHKKVKMPANVFAYVYGSVGSLVLGTGMCLAMKVIGDLMLPGIVIGLAGIAMVASTYEIYKAILKSRKKKYSKQILEMSDSLLNK